MPISPAFVPYQFRVIAILAMVMTCLFLVPLSAAEPDPVLGLRAIATSTPPRITLNWTNGGTHTIYRTSGITLPVGGGSPGNGWGSAIASVSGTSWVDSTVTVGGTGYEYRVVENSTGNEGYVYAGVELSVVDSRGAIVLVIEDALLEDLAFELDRLEADLVGEGYRVLREAVSRSDSPASVRNRLQLLRSSHSDLKTAFLLGHIPVQRSGWMNPDGHFSRCIPSDAFYADLDGTWTDNSVNKDVRSGNLSLHRNIPGDGYPDQTYLPSDTDLELGRVDFADMRAFLPQTETDLMRQYLDRDHAWRHGQLSVAYRSANMNGRINQCQGQLFATANPTTISGSGIPNPNFWAETEANDYLLFTKGGGGGYYVGTSGVGSTTDYANSTGVKVLINAQSASYYSEWDVEDAYLRAPLAAKGLGLISFYYELPTWILHHLGAGGTIGRSTRISQNNNGYYNQSFQKWGMSNSRRAVYIGLLGDPTLRIHVVKPPTSVRSNTSGLVTWTAPVGGGISGYHVYRATTAAGPFQRITTGPVSGTQFTDVNFPSGAHRYLVRSVTLESRGGSGSYWNSSVGILDNQGPHVVQALPVSRTSLSVEFDRPLNVSSSASIGNYQISGGVSVISATLQADQRSVLLVTSAHNVGATYSITASGILGTESSPVPGASTKGYVYEEVEELNNDAATIALYHLDGNGLDSSGNGYHLSLGSGLTFVGGSPYGSAHRCLKASGVDASGTQQGVATISDAVVLPSARPVTFEASIKIEGFAASGLLDADILTFGQSVWNGTNLQLAKEGKWAVAGNEYRSAASLCTGTTLLTNADFRLQIPNQRWVRLAMEYDGATSVYLYVDGVQIAGPITVTNNVGATSAWTVTLGNFVGCIDEVRISSVRRSQANQVLPATPTGVVATAGNAQATIGWSAVTGAASYRVQRGLSVNGPFTTVASGLASTVYVDSGLNNGTTYYYVVAAVNQVGTGSNSAAASATPSAPVALPAAPTDLIAVAGNAQSILTWNTVVTATSYRVQRRIGASGSFTTVASGLTQPTYGDTGLNNGTMYSYVVAAVNAAGTGANSASVSVTPQAPSGSGDEFVDDAGTLALYHFNSGYSDSGVNGLALIPAGGVSIIADNLGWMTNPSGSVARFSGIGATLSVPIADSLVLPGPNLTPLTIEARIYVRNYKAYGNANVPILALSQSWDTTIQVIDGKWNNPAGPQVGAGKNGTIVSSAVWDAAVTTNMWHALRIVQDSGGIVVVTIDDVVIGSAAVNQNIGRTNTWTLTLGNFDGDLDEVRISTVSRSSSTPLPPSAPTSVAVMPGNGNVDLSWAAVAGATSYALARATAVGGPYQSVADPVFDTAYTDVGLTNGTMYFYTVAARNAGGLGAASTPVSAMPVAPVQGSDEYVADAETVALYHFNTGYNDASVNGFTLVPSGAVSLAGDNLSWMESPAGQVARFNGLGATLSIDIPDALVLPGPVLTSLTIDARIYVRNYSAYSIENAPIISLSQSWDTNWQVMDGKWNNPHAPQVGAGPNGSIVSASVWDASVTRNAWHALRISQRSDGMVTVYVDGIVVGSEVISQNVGRSNMWTLILGNFAGDMDEIRISRTALGGPSG